MMKQIKHYQAPVSELVLMEWEQSFCLSGNVPSNSISDFGLINADDIDWDE